MPGTADVLIQAGHEGRIPEDGKPLGAAGEFLTRITSTPVVADAATNRLRQAGISVIRANADDLVGPYNVTIAIFIHFDGSVIECGSGASIGYNDQSDKPAADAWKTLYSKYWPFKWMDDNFTPGLRGYYGFAFTTTSDAELVLELGEITCPAQEAWLAPRREWLGDLIAHFVSQRIGKGNIPDPGSFGEDCREAWGTHAPFNAGFGIPAKFCEEQRAGRSLGRATSQEFSFGGRTWQLFERGAISWTPGSGATVHRPAPTEVVHANPG